MNERRVGGETALAPLKRDNEQDRVHPFGKRIQQRDINDNHIMRGKDAKMKGTDRKRKGRYEMPNILRKEKLWQYYMFNVSRKEC
jgi:hypothetical protein